MENTNSSTDGNEGTRQQQPGPASQEIIDLLAAAPNVLDFKPSEGARQRVWDLIAREKNGLLTPDERFELDHYGHLEHIMRLVKAQARKQRRTAT